jgi:hypothetical protein
MYLNLNGVSVSVANLYRETRSCCPSSYERSIAVTSEPLGMYIDAYRDTDRHVGSCPSRWAPVPHLQVKSLQAKDLCGNYCRRHTPPHTERQTGEGELYTVEL